MPDLEKIAKDAVLNNKRDVTSKPVSTRKQNQLIALNEWDRLPKETAVAYEAFMAYCNQEASRSLSDVSVLLNRRLATVERWSLRWNWVQRCRAFDIHQLEREQADARRERRGMRRRQAEAGRMMLAVGEAALLELQGKVEQGTTKLTPQDIVSLMRTGSVLERRARGEDTPDRSFTKIEVIFADGNEKKLANARLLASPAYGGTPKY